MALRLRTDSVRAYLHERADSLSGEPTQSPDGLCILPGQLLQQNLREYLNREGISDSSLARFETVESLAGDLLKPTDDPDSVLASGVRDRLLEGLLRSVDPDTAATLDDDPFRSRESEALAALAERLPYDDDETRETVLTEFDDYLRWTDAAHDVSPAVRELGGLDNQFAVQQSNRSMTAFRGIERWLETRLASLPARQHQSRSHLVHAARDAVAEQWSSQCGDVDWIAIAGINVLDNPTLRFLEALADHDGAPDVTVFINAGSAAYNAARFESLAIETDTPSDSAMAESEFEAETARALFDATRESPNRVPSGVDFVEGPTTQRVVERVATEVRELIQSGTHPRDILLVAPNAGDYQSLVEHAFETVELPVHVETRRPYADIPAYRCLRALVTVIEAVATGAPVEYGTLVDPLRLGYCPRGGPGGGWPIAGRDFTKVEQELHRKQQFYNSDPDRYEDQGIPVETWRDLIEEIPDWTGPWWAVDRYLDDAESLANSPPETGEELADLFGSYLGSYVFQTVDHKRSLYEAPGIDTTRTGLTEIHPTSLAERVRSRLDAAAAHYDRVRDLFDAPATWEEVGKALSGALGSQSYGKPHTDQHAVPLVDAGNAYFRDADHIYLLGMDAGEFPGEAPTSTYLHDALRQAAYESAVDGERPYHHLDSRSTGYGEALDFYQASLGVGTTEAEFTLCHTYRDERGNDVAWSSFVDLFELRDDGTPTDAVDRVAVGEWLPQPRSDEDWTAVTNRIAPRERLRALLYHAHREHPEQSPRVTTSALRTLRSRLAEESLEALVLPRLDRYHDPPTAVEIDPSEPAFTDISLEAVTGEPQYPHELDLETQCGLKYYYYQFLYNFTGDTPERASIPSNYADSPHYRLGTIPYVVRENYADPRYVEKWRQIVTDLLPERQSDTRGLAQFDSDQALRSWIEQQDTFGEYDFKTIYPNLRAERQLVAAERANGVTREWTWCSGGNVDIDGHTLGVPAYRRDVLSDNGSEYTLPIFFTRFSNRAKSALKSCYQGDTNGASEVGHDLCLSCEWDDCPFNSKYVVDHRMLAGCHYESTAHENKVAGIGLHEQYAGPDDGARAVAIRTGLRQKFHPFTGEDLFETLHGRGYKSHWQQKIDDWATTFKSQASRLDTSDTIELTANPELVTQDDCLKCVYRDLCEVPNRGVLD